MTSNAELFGLTVAQSMEIEDENAKAAWPFPVTVSLDPAITPTEADLEALEAMRERNREFGRRAEESCRKEVKENG